MSDPEQELITQAQRIASFGSSEDEEYFAEPGSPEAKLYLNRRMVRHAADVLNITPAEALENSMEVEGKHLYVWGPNHEGAVFIDADTAHHLYAPSSIEFAEHLGSFLQGIRS